MSEQQRTDDGGTIDTDNGEALDAFAKELSLSREELLNVIQIAGTRKGDIVDYVKKAGSPGTTP